MAKGKGKKGPYEFIIGRDDPTFFEQDAVTYDEAVRAAKEQAEEDVSGYADKTATVDVYRIVKVASVTSGMQTTVTKVG